MADATERGQTDPLLQADRLAGDDMYVFEPFAEADQVGNTASGFMP